MINLQYFYRNYDCNAKSSNDSDCICWHDSGHGPIRAKIGDTIKIKDPIRIGSPPEETHLLWREKPSHPKPKEIEQ